MRAVPAIQVDTGAGVVALDGEHGVLAWMPTAGARLLANALHAAADEADAAAALEQRVPGAGRTMLAHPQGCA